MESLANVSAIAKLPQRVVLRHWEHMDPPTGVIKSLWPPHNHLGIFPSVGSLKALGVCTQQELIELRGTL
jgi:hypothetical protein